MRCWWWWLLDGVCVGSGARMAPPLQQIRVISNSKRRIDGSDTRCDRITINHEYGFDKWNRVSRHRNRRTRRRRRSPGMVQSSDRVQVSHVSSRVQEGATAGFLSVCGPRRARPNSISPAHMLLHSPLRPVLVFLCFLLLLQLRQTPLVLRQHLPVQLQVN